MYKYLTLFALMCTTACGFSPLYVTDDNQLTTSVTGLINVEPIADYNGFKMHTLLEDQLNPDKISGQDKYDLIVTVDKPAYYEQNIRDDNFASREKIVMTAHYKLIDKQTKHVLIDTQTSATGSYNIVIEPYATYMAKKKIEEDLLKILSQTISLHITSYVKKNGLTGEG